MIFKGIIKRLWRLDFVYMIEFNFCEVRFIMWLEEILVKLLDDKVSIWRVKKENIDLLVEMVY